MDAARASMLEAILAGVTDGLIAQDGAGRLVYANDTAARLMGFASAAELVATSVEDILRRFEVYDEDGTVLAPGDLPAAAVRAGASVLEKLVRYRVVATGDERWSNLRMTATYDATGAVRLIAMLFRDVTHERIARAREQLLADATRELASSLDYTATLGVLARLVVPQLADWCVIELLDGNGVLHPLEVAHRDPAKVHWAREISSRYPSDPNRLSGPPQVVRTGRSELVPEITDAMVAASAIDEEHLVILRAVGFTSYLCVPLVAHGRAIGAISFVSAESGHRYGPRDLAFAEELARRAGMAIDNARLYREAQEASRLKDDFLATVSHELRTPLTAVLGWARMLRAGSVAEDKRARALETIERNARAQAQLIEDLLDIHRVISGKLRLEPVAIAPIEVVETAIEAVRPAADARNITVQPVLDPQAGPILADSDRLRQVVWNLLSNAVKFTPKGGRVRVTLQREGSGVEITVQDNGEGIDAAFLPYVFDRFRQADASTTRAQGGLGLGLAIARHLVELHGGTLRAHSEGRGRGATFVVRLPVSALRVRETPVPATRDPSPEGPPDAAVRLDGLRVLVVDDEADTRELVASVLSAAGATVTERASVREALAALADVVTAGTALPDVLVSDIGMPGEDGYAFVHQLRARAPTEGGRIPAVALTAYARTQDRTRALRAGFNSHVAKPVEPAELLVVVATLTGRLGGT